MGWSSEIALISVKLGMGMGGHNEVDKRSWVVIVFCVSVCVCECVHAVCFMISILMSGQVLKISKICFVLSCFPLLLPVEYHVINFTPTYSTLLISSVRSNTPEHSHKTNFLTVQ